LYFERMQGMVNRFASNSGWGFIRASPYFEGDLFFHIDNVMPHPFDKTFRMATGQTVEFTIVPDERDRPHAVLVKPLLNKTAYSMIGMGRFTGFVRKFEPGHGFINSPFFDGDLRCPLKNCLPNQVSFAFGQRCSFDITEECGEVVAKWMTTKSPSSPEDWVGQRRLPGKIKSFQDRWGFINSDRFAGDLFVHRDCIRFHGSSELRLLPGTPVEFEVGIDDASRGARLLGVHVLVLESNSDSMVLECFPRPTRADFPQEKRASPFPLPLHSADFPQEKPCDRPRTSTLSTTATLATSLPLCLGLNFSDPPCDWVDGGHGTVNSVCISEEASFFSLDECSEKARRKGSIEGSDSTSFSLFSIPPNDWLVYRESDAVEVDEITTDFDRWKGGCRNDDRIQYDMWRGFDLNAYRLQIDTL